MSVTESQTQTYSVLDIGKVIDCVAADLDMNAQSTGLLSRESVKQYAGDVKLMAQKGYLLEANIVLWDASGEPIRAGKYEVSTDASSLTVHRPGNNLWPRTPGGELGIVVQYTAKWRELDDVQKQTFRQTLSGSWSTSNTDLSFPSLTGSADRNYVRNGWGVRKSSYS